MILQALCDFYVEQVHAGNPDYAPVGMELKRIHFVLVLDRDGRLIDIEQLDKKVHVVRSRSRSGKEAARISNYMWDSLGYITGYGANGKQGANTAVQHASFKMEAKRLAGIFPDNPSFSAVTAFYDRGKYLEQLSKHPLWDILSAKPGHNLSFRLSGEELLAAQQSELLQMQTESGNWAECLVTGDKKRIARLHPRIYVPGGAATGTKLVSFMSGCGYDSYNKRGGENAPVSVEMTEAYAAALTGLLQQESSHSVMMGGMSIVFFTLPHTRFCEAFRSLIDPSVRTDREDILNQMCDLAYSGQGEAEFVGMLIAPNAARLSVRLYLRTTVGQLSENIFSFYNDLTLAHGNDFTGVLPLLSPLFLIAPQGDAGKLPFQLIADYFYAVATHTRFPVQLQRLLLDRLRQSKEPNIGLYMMLRCYLNRNIVSPNQYITMALDKDNRNVGYLLGRLFAILERVQEIAHPGGSFTIRDSYYNMASITPIAVFNRLIGLSHTYFRRVSAQSAAIYLKIQLNEVTGMLDGIGIPTRLTLDDQSRFALGYFHQRQIYFMKKEHSDEQGN